MSSTSFEQDRPLCLPADTTLEAARVQFAALRRMTPAQRLEMGCKLNDEVRALVKAGVRHRHPEYDEEQVRIATVRLLIGEEWFKVCFPGCDVQP